MDDYVNGDGTKPRFKIDASGESYFRIALFVRSRGIFGEKWTQVDTFREEEGAIEHYEKIKNLPKYLR